MRRQLRLSFLSIALSVAVAMPLAAQSRTAWPWQDRSLSPEKRARAAVAAMTEDEKLSLVFGFTDPEKMGEVPDSEVPPDVRADDVKNQIPGSAGYIRGIPRLGIPAQQQTDASIGVRVNGVARTALPSSLATAASFDPAVTEMGGKMIAQEARRSGFNVFLAGGANLAREPRNGRNFEYVGEDPLLAGVMAGALIDGIQSQHMVSTMKHFAVNDQESERESIDVHIDPTAMRQSDLLAFQLVLEHGRPGSVMCSYNKVNSYWACENDYLQNQVLKRDWGFKGYVMSDWGAVHSDAFAANAGLDQQTGFSQCCGDKVPHFGAPLKAALADGKVSKARLDDMVTRILWALFAKGAYDDPPRIGPIDFAHDADVSQSAAEQSLVLLKNQGDLLPLTKVKSLAVIGGHADVAVLSGGGSSDVNPIGGNPVANPGDYVIYYPSSPMKALQANLPDATVRYDGGADRDAAAKLAASSDAAIVFVTKWDGEGSDQDLELDNHQDELVAAVAKANPRTIVVVESGGAVFMPWRDQVPAILEAFYPGQRGGEAIANILTGKVNPAGHLPITFPASRAQFARQRIVGMDGTDKPPLITTYGEGAAIGYKWYDLKGYTPLYAFGHGLSYTRFRLSRLQTQVVRGNVHASVTVTNIGKRAGATVAQFYAFGGPKAHWEAPKRLVGFRKVKLAPGQSSRVDITVDPRLLADWDERSRQWAIAPDTYRIEAGEASDDLPLSAAVASSGRFDVAGRPIGMTAHRTGK